MDKFSKSQRSKIMKSIKSKDTFPEIALRKLVFSLGYRYRLYGKDLPGKPDLVFRSKRKIIFLHGCFWHQHSRCRDGHIPDSNKDYWVPKLNRTKIRDQSNIRRLRADGWKVLVVWECELKKLEKLSNKIVLFLD